MKKYILFCLALSVHTVLYSTNRLLNETFHHVRVRLRNNAGTKTLFEVDLRPGIALTLNPSDINKNDAAKEGLRLTIIHRGVKKLIRIHKNNALILMKEYLKYPFPEGVQVCKIFYNQLGEIAIEFQMKLEPYKIGE